MTLLTLGKYLFGNREAILQVARSPGALGVGLLFVIAAGFAREYDGEDLLAEPWHLLIPLGASVVSSLVLYLLLRLAARNHQAAQPGMLQGYADFLTLYWMTAPLALLYAIPFERFLSAVDAVGANLWILGIVATWRVLLIARVVSVLYQASYLSVLCIVMLFADTLAIGILCMTSLPLVSVMGGIRLSESEELLVGTQALVQCVGVLTWPLWIVGAWVAAGMPVFVPAPPQTPPWRYALAAVDSPVRVAQHVWIAAASTVAVWVLVLPFSQPEQRLRRQVEQHMLAGRIEEAIVIMSAHEPGDFPPHWDPLPRALSGHSQPDISDIQEYLNQASAAPWVKSLYARKYGDYIDFHAGSIERHIGIIERMPERTYIVRKHSDYLRWIAEHKNYPESLRDRIRALLIESGERSESE